MNDLRKRVVCNRRKFLVGSSILPLLVSRPADSFASECPLSRADSVSSLFKPLRIGELDLPNRVVMAPLTRCRASAAGVPNMLMAQYYAQRASAGLIISEATVVTPMGYGYPD